MNKYIYIYISRGKISENFENFTVLLEPTKASHQQVNSIR